MNTITITSTINANLADVWKKYTSPEHIVNWNFADDSWHCPTAKNDMKIGGKYLARMEAKDGSFGFDFEAIYTNITEEKEFSYEFGGRNCTVSFNHLDNQTEVTITFEPETEHPLEMQKNGWQAILNNFKQYAEK
ncbi:MAG: SRPBCC domain-containing protein [Limnohabitans sp.]|nr:SRPBCC domain-containing protein [Limnohabitans sp.]